MAATSPGLTTTDKVVPGSGIFDLVVYLGLELVGFLRLACENRLNFEYFHSCNIPTRRITTRQNSQKYKMLYIWFLVFLQG